MFHRAISKARTHCICHRQRSITARVRWGMASLLCEPEAIKDIPIKLTIQRANKTVFDGEANTSMMKRTITELTEFLTRELDFPNGVFLMTGTCLVPDDFTLLPDDVVTVQVGETKIENRVTS